MPRTGGKWDQRIDRARELANAHPYSAQILTFYATVATFQKGSYQHFQCACGSGNGRGTSLPAELDAVDLELQMTRFGPFLSLVGRDAPGSLAEFARNLEARGPVDWLPFLRESWPVNQQPHAERDPFAHFCAEVFLQPYAEFLADHADLTEPAVRRGTCPYCASLPVAGVLRQEGDGAKRSLLCSFCRTEWDYLRIACPACEEGNEKKLCVYTTERFAHVRVEACDTCRSYVKTVDLTRNGLAVPEVDELDAIPLSLWAHEKGYKKVHCNFVGL